MTFEASLSQPSAYHSGPLPFPSPPRGRDLTIEQIVYCEPGVARILDSVRLSRRHGAGWSQTYARAKREMAELVGFAASHPALRTSAAYQISIHAIVAALEGRSRAKRRRAS